MLDELTLAARRVLASGAMILGPEVDAFEREVASALGAPHAIGVSSGTDALLCALQALELRAGDEVITTPFSFIATAEAILRAGATPRFVDIEPATYNLDATQVEAAVGERTRAILVVHLYGHPAELHGLQQIAERHALALVEDCAQAFGARLDGRALGTWGAFGCFSFFPAKPLGGAGDGGLVTTGRPELAQRIRRLRVHGATAKYRHEQLGGNYRLDELQAALLRVKLARFDAALARRRELASRYAARLPRHPDLRLPTVEPGAEPAWASYTLAVRERRDELAAFLLERGVQTAVHYPKPLHQQPALAPFLPRDVSLPHSERAAREVLSLPLFPSMTADQLEHVAASVADFFAAPRALQRPEPGSI